MPSLLALSVDWWNVYRDIPPVLAALRQVDSEHLLPLVDGALEKNRNNHGSGPKTRLELAKRLARDEGNLSRKLNGTSESTWSDMLALAQILKLPAETLFLPAHVRVHRAVCVLCGPTVDPDDATAYTLYRFSCPAAQTDVLDQRCLVETAATFKPVWSLRVVELAVRRVAERLECVLEQASQASLKKRERSVHEHRYSKK